jgi:transcriptional regulator with XRE-family HTH domain
MTTTPSDAAVAGEIRAELGRQRLTQIELAIRLGEKRSWVARRLIGETPITVTDLARIADALGVPASTFTVALDS